MLLMYLGPDVRALICTSIVPSDYGIPPYFLCLGDPRDCLARILPCIRVLMPVLLHLLDPYVVGARS